MPAGLVPCAYCGETLIPAQEVVYRSCRRDSPPLVDPQLKPPADVTGTPRETTDGGSTEAEGSPE